MWCAGLSQDRRSSSTGQRSFSLCVWERHLLRGEQLSVLREITEGLKGRRRASRHAHNLWPDVFAEQLPVDRAADADVRSKSFGLSLTFGDPKAIESQRAVLSDKKAEPAARLDALNALVGVNAPNLAPDCFSRWCTEPALQSAALKALAGFDDSKTPKLVLDTYASLSPDVKRDAIGTLASRAPFALELLRAVEKAAKQVAAERSCLR